MKLNLQEPNKLAENIATVIGSMPNEAVKQLLEYGIDCSFCPKRVKLTCSAYRAESRNSVAFESHKSCTNHWEETALAIRKG